MVARTSGEGRGLTIKTPEGTFGSDGVMEIFYLLTEVVVT